MAAERFAQDFAFVAVHERSKWAVAFGEYGRSGGDVGLQCGRQVVGVDANVCCGKAGVLDAVFEFAHVTGPVVAHKHVYGGRA